MALLEPEALVQLEPQEQQLQLLEQFLQKLGL